MLPGGMHIAPETILGAFNLQSWNHHKYKCWTFCFIDLTTCVWLIQRNAKTPGVTCFSLGVSGFCNNEIVIFITAHNHKDTKEDIISVSLGVALVSVVTWNWCLFYYYREPPGHQGGHHFCFPLCLIGVSSNQIGICITTENHKATRETIWLSTLWVLWFL